MNKWSDGVVVKSWNVGLVRLGAFEKAMANALKFVEHPKAKQFDVRQSFDNTFVDEAMK